jgi:hypothetical protein
MASHTIWSSPSKAAGMVPLVEEIAACPLRAELDAARFGEFFQRLCNIHERTEHELAWGLEFDPQT